MATFHGQTVDVHEDFENALDGSWVETDTDNNLDPNDTTKPFAGSASMSVDFYGDTAGVENTYVRYDMGAERTDLSIGFWFFAGAMSSFSGDVELAYWAAATLGTNNLRLVYFKAGGSAYTLKIRGTGFSVNAKTLTVNQWHWITLDLNKNGTCTLRVYDAAEAEIDAGISVTTTAGNNACQYLFFGLITATDEEGVVYYDDVVADWTAQTFPLLGWDVGGGVNVVPLLRHRRQMAMR